MSDGETVGGVAFDVDADDETRRAFVTEQLMTFNRAHSTALSPVAGDGMAPEASAIGVYALDASGGMIGGVVGRTHTIRDWLEVTILWVDERARGRGLGRELMARAESEALRRGCRYARLATSNFQAPGFYERVGYRLYGTLENCPPGVTCFYYWKILGVPVGCAVEIGDGGGVP